MTRHLSVTTSRRRDRTPNTKRLYKNVGDQHQTEEIIFCYCHNEMSSDCGYNASPQTYICIPRDIYLVALRANFVVLDKVKVASCNVSSVREAAVFSRAKWRQLVITSSILRARRCLCLSGSGYCELRPAPAGGLTDDCLDTNFIFDVDIKKNLVNADDTMANVSRHADHFVCLFLNSSTLNSINL